MIPPPLIIANRNVAEQCLLAEREEASGLTNVLSIGNAADPPSLGFEEFQGHKLALFFDDVVTPHKIFKAPKPDDAKKIVEWARAVRGPTLIHCGYGISRSTAAAIAIPACHGKRSQDDARAIMLWLAAVRPVARPNALLVKLIDRQLGWKGHLFEARMWRFPG